MTDILFVLQGFLGLFVFCTFAWALSEKRKQVDLKKAILGVCIQFFVAILAIKVPLIHRVFLWISSGVLALKDAMLEGTKFVFGYLGGGAPPFVVKEGGNTFIFMFQALPMVMVISALAMLLCHWRILPVVVRAFSWIFQKTMGIGSALAVCCAAKIFFGQTEAPLLVKPYLSKFTRSELFTMMTTGMATTSVSLMVLYSTILEGTIPSPVAHILAASIINIPAAIVISRLIIPQCGENTSGDMVVSQNFSNAMDAIALGATDGMRLMLNIAAMLVVALALITLVNKILGAALPPIQGTPVTLQLLMGYLLAPITWLMGIPWSEAVAAGSLLGIKTVLNEVAAFIELSGFAPHTLSPTSNLIMMYALCGFANFTSIAIQIAGIGAMVPDRRVEITSLGFKAFVAGTLSSCMSGTIIGILYHIHL